MAKEWYIFWDQKEEGPYAREELCRDPRLSPDLWVRKAPSQQWVKARFVEELQSAFLDPPEESLHQPLRPVFSQREGLPEQDVLTLSQDPFQRFLFLLLLLLILLFLYQAFRGP